MYAILAFIQIMNTILRLYRNVWSAMLVGPMFVVFVFIYKFLLGTLWVTGANPAMPLLSLATLCLAPGHY